MGVSGGLTVQLLFFSRQSSTDVDVSMPQSEVEAAHLEDTHVHQVTLSLQYSSWRSV